MRATPTTQPTIRDLLRDLLDHGRPMAANAIKAATARAWSWRTVHRAGKHIGVVVEKSKGSITGGWQWTLPQSAAPEAATLGGGSIEGATHDASAPKLPAPESGSHEPSPPFAPSWPGTGVAEPATPAKAPDRPFMLSKAQGDAAHRESWDDAAIARFTARTDLLEGLGLVPQNAEDIAERLHLRDVERDDLRICLECAHMDQRGRCEQPQRVRLPTADRRVWPVALMLHRCPSFNDRLA